MMKQKDISKALGIHQSEVSRVLKGERKISWPLAEKLSNLFPAKTIKDWKNATPDEFKKALRLLDIEKGAA